MSGPQTELSDANVGIAGNIHTAAGPRIDCSVSAEHQDEVNRLGIGLRRNDGNGHRTVLVSAAYLDQAKNQNAQQTGNQPKIHPHPRTIHESIWLERRSILMVGWNMRQRGEGSYWLLALSL